MTILFNVTDIIVSSLPIFIPYVLPIFCLVILATIPCLIRYLVRFR